MEPRAPSLLYVVKQVELAVRAHLDELLRPTAITTTQYTAMTVLARSDGLTSADLARNSFVTAQTMNEVITALERRDLISRRPDPAHGRRLRTSLTPAGRTLLADVADRVRALEERMLADLDTGDRAHLRDLLNRCRTALAVEPAR